MEAPKKPRNTFLDVIKGGLIILVVIGHVTQTTFANFDDNLLFRLIYSFHMPLFIGISGYVAFISLKEVPFIKNVWKKFLQLVIPFLSWYFIYGFLTNSAFRRIDITSYTTQLIKSPDYGLWFLWILFLCYVVLYLVREFIKIPQTLIKSKYLEIIAFIVILIFLYSLKGELLGLGLLKWHLPSFIVGYLIAENIGFFMKFKKLITEATFLGYPTLLYFWQRTKDPRVPHIFLRILKENAWIITTGFRYVVALLGSIFFVSVLYRITNESIKKFLEFLGKQTLDIYVVHFNFLGLVGIMGLINVGSNVLNYVSIALCTIIIIGLSLFVSRFILRQSSILTFLFLGSKN